MPFPKNAKHVPVRGRPLVSRRKPGKRDRPIVVYGVLADAMGRPLAVQAYAGNTGDPTTVPDQVEKVRGRFGLQRVVLVGDRGLLTETQINHLKRHPGLGWVSALRHHQIRRLVESEAVQLSLFDERHLAEVRPLGPGRVRRLWTGTLENTAAARPSPARGFKGRGLRSGFGLCLVFLWLAACAAPEAPVYRDKRDLLHYLDRHGQGASDRGPQPLGHSSNPYPAEHALER